MCNERHCRALQCHDKARFAKPNHANESLSSFRDYVSGPFFPHDNPALVETVLDCATRDELYRRYASSKERLYQFMNSFGDRYQTQQQQHRYMVEQSSHRNFHLRHEQGNTPGMNIDNLKNGSNSTAESNTKSNPKSNTKSNAISSRQQQQQQQQQQQMVALVKEGQYL
mmetsp:Transcript_19321/g.32780  ORF Transcript_19321/g.32780 Transcript_19321/m.32780 type:complete len:169 (+) Transcript_19321:1124-1630(+)